jgi:hypothetical protein
VTPQDVAAVVLMFAAVDVVALCVSHYEELMHDPGAARLDAATVEALAAELRAADPADAEEKFEAALRARREALRQRRPWPVDSPTEREMR